ncbi:MAG: FAD-dependent oxidoreductase [Acidimicrobiia bacterium]|nr:FAD-dependent oxidoreductase [Acidimicrobiia bacterium]
MDDLENEQRYRSRSLWLNTLPGSLSPRASLDTNLDVDVAIIGAGYTGLWTAYELAKQDPTLRIAVLEAEIAGFGASGRNGGWCSALFAGDREAMAAEHGRDLAVALQKEMFATIDEVGAVCEFEGIDADFYRGGTLNFATSPAHVERIRADVDNEHLWGFTEKDFRWLSPSEANERIAINGSLGASFTPHCARIQPAKLVRGLAEAVERRGVTIYERSRVTEIAPYSLRTCAGTVRTEVIVRATEGYTPNLKSHHRTLIPVYSLMIATESLPSSFFDEVGWKERETFTDGRHLLIYGQRTFDDRIAFGGRGAPYHFGSSIKDEFDRDGKTFEELRKVLWSLFPSLGDARITHQWGGPLGIPRDWYSSVGFDRATGMAWAGGYVGDGVGTSNLAGRTLAHLITGTNSDLTALPWVNHHSRKWEPEPLRWVGVNAAKWATQKLDRREGKTGKRAKGAERILKRVLGGH